MFFPSGKIIDLKHACMSALAMYCTFQTRGSIPIFWSQLPNLKYKPKPEAIAGANHLEGLSRHFDSQVLNYGKQVVINLVCGSIISYIAPAILNDIIRY